MSGRVYPEPEAGHSIMPFKKSSSLLLAALAGLLMACLVSNEPDFQKLSEGFFDPPIASRPGAFWAWLNGDVTKASITHDLEEMKAKGMSRAEIWDVAAVNNPAGAYGVGPPFLGDKSVEMIKHALSEGKRLGMKIGMVGSSGWNAGGPWVAPDWASKALFFSELEVTGPSGFAKELPFPTVPEACPKDGSGKPVFYREVAIVAVPVNPEKKIVKTEDIINLGNHFDGKILTWKIPQGTWMVLRFICSNTGQTLIVPSPGSGGLFIDFLDPAATQRHLGHILGRLGITPANAAGSGLSYLEFDSMELDPGTPWTDDMASIFKAESGYDILPFLPVFAGWEMPDGNAAFLYQFHKSVSDRLIFSHYTTGRDFLGKYAMQLVAEAGGPGPPIWDTCPVDALKALGNVSIPRGEFWVRHRNMFLIKEVASASHTYGLKIVDAESFTTWRRWKDAPHDLKKYVDRAFCEGLNNITIHTFANTRPEHGLPGRTYHAGIDINPGTTWWQQARPFMDYLSRCSYLLRQGIFVADVAWYYGDKAPNFFPEFHDVPERPRLEGLSPGYDFDVINTDVLLHRMQVRGDRIILRDGMSYSLLVIPDRSDIPEAVIEKLREMARAGARVLAGSKDLAAKIGEGALVEKTIDAALEKLSVARDFISETGQLDYIHRKIGETDLYFVRNPTDRRLTESCSFRVSEGHPELWDPVRPAQFRLENVQRANGITRVPISLAPYASCFIVFNKEREKAEGLPAPDLSVNGTSGYEKTLEIAGPWKVRFPENRGAPGEVELNELISWIDHPDPGVKYFSGTASYHHKIQYGKPVSGDNKRVFLDLGDVRDVAEVIVNGVSAGILWTKPFTADIGPYLKDGENDLQINITNMWVNRLTGDMDLPPDERICKTNQPFIRKDNWAGGGDETYHLQDAGLIGPVRLVTGTAPGRH